MGNYKYGVWVPRNVNEALEVDKKNGNSLWQDSIYKEVEALQQFKTFKAAAKATINAEGKKIQWAPLQMTFDVKEVS